MARQHAFAADCQSEYVSDVLRKSRHGFHPEHLSFTHLAYRRKEHVAFDTVPVGVVHFTTTF